MNIPLIKFLILFSLTLFFGRPSYGYQNKEVTHPCLNCHNEITGFYESNIHGKVFRCKRAGKEDTGDCGACHGSGIDHKVSAEREDKVLVSVKTPFLRGSEYEKENNATCLACHDKGEVSQWRGSAHKFEGIGCTDCHRIHGEEQGRKVLFITEACVRCHVEIRARMQRTSHMALRDGKMNCTDCHNPHGSAGPSLLKEKTLNENCYRCHMEKRGPLIWEHAPVRENCGNCHDPHGSNQEALLTMRIPYLCQSCHSMASHSSALYDGNALAGLNKNMVGKGCLNCHSLIHGSNHPSGSAYSR